MEDIKNYLQEKDAIAACFRMDGNNCKITIATESQEHLKEIVDNWEQVEVDNSQLQYQFKLISFLSREEQIHIIQKEINHEGATALIQAEEQQVARICQEYGASEVWYKHYGDKMEFYITGTLDEEIMEELKQVNKSREHIYMNPPRCRWSYTEQGEVETLGSVTPLKAEAIVNSGEQLL